MVDVGSKTSTQRLARASGSIALATSTVRVIADGTAKKGDVLGVARIAAIQAAKRTSELIPLCHPIALTRIDVSFTIDPNGTSIHSTVTVACEGKTGVEMEAIVGCQIGLATIYDMCKAIDRGMTISNVRLDEKQGGRSGHWERQT